MNAAPVREGDVLAGKYQVERVLGIGGMGVVIAARHLHLDEQVALKFLLPAAALRSEVLARFAQEARAAAKIKSEHVARVMDVGVLDSGEPYLVLEYLKGIDLAELLKRRGALPVDEALEYLLQACEALGEAHSLGIVHRDLKPGNLFLTRRHDGSPCVKVLDFGISKVSNSAATDLAMTSTNAVMGSPLYMSPEQLLSARAVDHRTDVWSLGVILYELLTARPPFNGETLTQVALRIAQEAPRPMRDRRPDLLPGIEAVVLRCLEKDAGKRVQNVGELAKALGPFAPTRARHSVERVTRMMRDAGLSASIAILPPSSDPVVPLHGSTAAAWEKSRGGSKLDGSRWLFGGAVALGALGLAGWSALRSSRQTAELNPAASAVTSPQAARSSPFVAPARIEPPESVLQASNASSVPPATVQPALAISASPRPKAATTLPSITSPALRAPALKSPPAFRPTPASAPTPSAAPAKPPAPAKEFDFGGR